MRKPEARQKFVSYIFWQARKICWEATPTRPNSVRYRVHNPEPEPTPPAVIPMPSPDLRRSANAMVADERETDLITVTPWVQRWVDISQAALPKPIVATERKSEPMVTPRGVAMVIVTIILTLAIVEALFGPMISERMRKRRHRGFAR